MDRRSSDGSERRAAPLSEGVLLQLLRMADLATSRETAEFLRDVYARERLRRLDVVGR